MIQVTPIIAASFGDELEKIARLRHRDLAAIGAGTGAMLNIGGRVKYRAGLDAHPAQKGRTLGGDAAKGAAAAVVANAILTALSKGRLKRRK